MTNEIISAGPHKDFEEIKKIDKNSVEYWEARELMFLLGYSQWRNFEEVIGKAARACLVWKAGRMWITILLKSAKWSKSVQIQSEK